jgi:UDP-N-acetylglucosamine--N-acetylmuramyl-(pentapeptide) pyrophosphoryl-undecaprenol N-acetylglucosamine transferase
MPFIKTMGAAWGAANLVVGRSGAGAVAEVWANKVPALFLPYPYHRDQHQKVNAGPIVKVGGAVIVDDLVNAEENLSHAGETLAGLLTDRSRLEIMRKALESLGSADGARRVAEGLVGITGR